MSALAALNEIPVTSTSDGPVLGTWLTEGPVEATLFVALDGAVVEPLPFVVGFVAAPFWEVEPVVGESFVLVLFPVCGVVEPPEVLGEDVEEEPVLFGCVAVGVCTFFAHQIPAPSRAASIMAIITKLTTPPCS